MKLNTSLLFIAFILIIFGCNSSEEIRNQKVKNIILIIGNSSRMNGDKVGTLVNQKKSNIERASVAGFSKTYQAKNSGTVRNSVPTVLAIGKEGNNKTLGLDADGIAYPNLIELASVKGLSTGLITTGSATDVLPASFIVHTIDRTQIESVTAEYLNSPIDLFIGGGLQYFTDRKYSTNLIQRLKNKGYLVCHEIENATQSGKLMLITNDNQLKSTQIIGSQLLLKSTNLALQSLSSAKNGFFLIIDGCLPDAGNGEKRVVDQNNAIMVFDQSVGIAFDFADKNPGTLVVVTTDLLESVYAYGISAQTFEGSYENSEIFSKMVTLLSLAVQ